MYTTKTVAQQNSTAAGAEATGAGTVSYSVGQVAYTYIQSAAHNANQGVQQPYEFFTLLISESVYTFDATVFPNPSSNDVLLEIKEPFRKGMSCSLYDEQGKLIASQSINASKTIIPTSQLANATYLLEVKLNDRKITGFKIIKH
ncbi:MAG TPA: T9SS type A sorting domain-containing protein [Flavobacteriales bacterium]|nr:T9SS type A sorting domain-containing protein [Flavobacteriales bacterium]